MPKYLSRSASREVACPRCDAKPGAQCQGVRGPRESSHQERVEHAEAAIAAAKKARRAAR